jgi:NAD+ synthase (glutamine-hydrolysing)
MFFDLQGETNMRLVRIGLVSIDTTVGACESNTDKAIAYAKILSNAGCTLGVFQECVFGGYPAEDLILHEEFMASQLKELMRFAEVTRTYDTAFVLGINVRASESMPYNAAVVVHGGKILGIVPKEHLPSYGVFDERRVFTAGVPGLYREVLIGDHKVPFGDLVFEFPFGTLATYVCEDTWQPGLPRAVCEIVVVPNASPARSGVVATREEMLSTRSADNECVIAAAYQVGGNDSLVFDGGGFVFQNGQLIDKAELFHEGFSVIDVDLSRTRRMRNQNTTWRARQEVAQRTGETFRRIIVANGPSCFSGPVIREFAQRFDFLPKDEAARKHALDYLTEIAINGLKGYFEKSKAFKKILISLSGGKDSCLTLVLAWLYARRYAMRFPPEQRNQIIRDLIICVSQPTRFNSDETKSIAREFCEELGVTFIEEPIQDEYEAELAKLRKITGLEPDVVTRGNVQARIRGERMWNLANMYQGLWLQTGNMTEKSVGYTTIGGDLMGGYSLIGNIPKTVVSHLLVHIGDAFEVDAVDALMKTRASAELEENQYDEDQLMPFDVLDLCFLLFAGELYSPVDMYRIIRARWTDLELLEMTPRYKNGMLKDWIELFLRKFRTSIFKWVVSPQSVHMGSLDLDRERALQIPVITSPEWLERSLAEMRKL